MLFLLLQASVISAEPPPSNSRVFEIPFEYKNHFILIKLVFEKRLPLTFIFDTGAETTLLTSIEVASAMSLSYEREIQIVGADLEMELRAFLVRDVHLKLNELSLDRQSILVLEEDVFHFNEYTGEEIHGILGANVFRRFVVEIDFEKRVIRLISPNDFVPPKKTQRLPIEVHRGKPYLKTVIKPANKPEMEIKLLLDSGAGLAMLLHPDSNPDLDIPEKVVPGNIGMGLGGDLVGVVGIIPRLYIGESELREVPVHFQEIANRIDSVFLNQRNGILGNQILERYTVTLDYFRGYLYLAPNRKAKKSFPIDKTGLVVIASGPDLNTFLVHAVLNGSPAQEAGIKPGDVILRINYASFRLLDIDNIYHIFSRRAGKKIRMKVERNGEKIKLQFRLEPLLEIKR